MLVAIYLFVRVEEGTAGANVNEKEKEVTIMIYSLCPLDWKAEEMRRCI